MNELKNILVTGANGMFGQDFAILLEKSGFNPVKTDVHNMDITDENAIRSFVKANPCDVIVHAAAYTNVDGAESDPETAFLINKTGSENLAKISAEMGIPIVYLSTDYVFDGTKNTPYLPQDKTNPINTYGASKLAGEQAIMQYNPRHYICRTSWLYGHKGKNFVETMIKLSKEKTELNVVNDQKGCPTWTVDLGNAIINLLKEEKGYGIYHTCGTGNTTWYDFANTIFDLMQINIQVKPVTSDEFPRPAKRPAYSVMNNNGLLRDWKSALQDYINLREKEL